MLDSLKSLFNPKRHLLNQYSVLSSVIIFAFGGMYLVLFKTLNIALFCAISSLLCLFTPIVHKVSKSYFLSIAYLLITSISIVVYTSIYTGGLKSPVLFWITVLPLTGSFLTRVSWSSFKWSVVPLVCFLIVFLKEALFGRSPSEINENQMQLVHVFALFGIGIYNIIFSHLFASELSKENLVVESQKNELEQTLEKLKKAQADLIQSEKLASLGTIAAILAHEINNAMHYSSGLTKIIIKKITAMPNDKEIKNEILEHLGAVSRGMEITIGVVQSVSNLTGINRAKVEALKIRDVVQSVQKLVGLKLMEKEGCNISIQLNIDDTTSIVGSTVGLHQIMMNLINNAIDAMPNGGVLTISASTENEMCKISVKDTGQGMSPEILDKIFLPFFTTKNNTSGTGTGLGLHVVKTEVEKHKGTIDVISKVGVGTEFILKLKNNLRSEDFYGLNE